MKKHIESCHFVQKYRHSIREKFSIIEDVINKVSATHRGSAHNIYKARDSGFWSQTLESQFKHL